MGRQVTTWAHVEITLAVGYEKQKEAFHTVEECLGKGPLFAYPVAGEKFVLAADACRYRKGGKHVNAGALSCRPCKLECKHFSKAKVQDNVAVVRLLRLESNEDWSTAQRNDPVLAKIISAKTADKRPTRNDIAQRAP